MLELPGVYTITYISSDEQAMSKTLLLEPHASTTLLIPTQRLSDHNVARGLHIVSPLTLLVY